MARRRSYTLRALLIFIVLLAGFLSWVGFNTSIWRERQAADLLHQTGAFVALADHANKGPRASGLLWFLDTRPVVFVSGVKSDEIASHLPKMKRLDSVSLGGSVTDAGVAHIVSLNSLTSLAMVCPQVTDACVRHVVDLSNLKSLTLTRTAITDSGLEQISQLRRLEELCLDHTEITDAGLQHVAGLLELKSLSLHGTKVTDRGLEHLGNLTQLESLGIQDTGVTLAGVARLFMDLQQRDLDAGLAAFVGNYSSLNIGGPPNVRLMGQQSIDVLLPYVVRNADQVRSLTLNVEYVSDADLVHLGNLKQLEELHLYGLHDHRVPWTRFDGCPKLKRIVTLSGQQLSTNIVGDVGTLANLEYLRLRFEEVAGDGILSEVAALSNLKTLSLSYTPITKGFEELPKLKHLERLYLNETGISDQGLEHLARLNNLEKLELGKTRITDRGLRSIAETVSLKELRLNDTAVSDAAVASLKRLTNLRLLRISGTNFTEAGIQKLEVALPQCQIGSEEFNRRVRN